MFYKTAPDDYDRAVSKEASPMPAWEIRYISDRAKNHLVKRCCALITRVSSLNFNLLASKEWYGANNREE